jgi:HSP20 family protein
MFVPASSAFQEAVWRPAADIYRTGTGWLVKLDLAGVHPDEVVVQVCGRCLTVRGSRRDWLLEEGLHYHSLEITYSRFERSFEFPAELEHAHLVTEYRAGMLLVRIQTEGKGP